MHNKDLTLRSLVLSALCIFLLEVGCKRASNSRQRDSSGDTAGIISGQVFIVTRGAENVRLGQLMLYLAPLKTFEDLHVTERRAAKVAELEQAFAKARIRGDESERLVSDIKRSYSVLLAQRDRWVDQLAAVQLIHAKYNVVKGEITSRDALLNQFKRDLNTIGSDSYDQCKQIAADLESISDAVFSATYNQLTPRSAGSKSDADGRFRFECSLDEDYVLFTRGNRLLPVGSKEHYQWLIRVRPSRDEKHQVLLTNDNLIEGLAPENLMRDIGGGETHSVEMSPSQSRALPGPKLLPSEPRWAPPGVLFLLGYISVRTDSGVRGLPPGTQVKEDHHNGDNYAVQFENAVLDVPLSQLTDNADIAQRLRDADTNAQTQIALWQNAQREIERQNKDAENRQYDEEQRRIQANYKRLHTLTGESRLNEPARP
jgi:hypothetical protein